MPEINPPLWQQNPTYPAAVDRELFAALTDGPGVAREESLQVSAGSGLAVDVAAGHAFVEGTESATQGRYLVASSSTVTLPLAAADPSNPRNDLIVARVQDAFYSGATNAWSIEAITGTPASSPVDPSVPANVLLLARVRVDAGAASIDPGKITDLRTLAPYKAGSPIGTVVSYAGPTAPAGWLRCDGSTISRTLYAGLFAVIGTTFGSGDGSTTFGLPDLRGRVAIGTGTLGSDTYAPGDADGAARVTLTDAQIPAHGHASGGLTTSNDSHSHASGTIAASSAGAHSHSGSVGGSGVHPHSIRLEGSDYTHRHNVIAASAVTSQAQDGSAGSQYFSDGPIDASVGGNNRGEHSHSVSVNSNGAHSHSTTGSTSGDTHNHPISGSTDATGGGGSHENRPPFLALVPIIRAA